MAIELARRAESPLFEGVALHDMGDVLLALGDETAARRHWEQALVLLEGFDLRRAEQVRHKLAR